MDIAIIGSANMDLTLVVSEIPEKGKTIKCQQSLVSPGGKGANQAIAAARIGANVGFIAKIGNDVFGSMILKSLHESGVQTDDVIISDDYQTGKAIILVCDGDNRIIIDGGSNDQLTADEIRLSTKKIVQTASGILLQNEIPLAAIHKAVMLCKGNIPIFLNPAPAINYPEELLVGIDYFIPNETECQFYTGIRPFDQHSCERAIDRLRRMGIRVPIITLGEKGVAYFDDGKCVISNSFMINAVDSTAGGDTFAGVFATMISKNMEIEAAIRIAQAAAAITCTRYGAQSAIPYKNEVDRFLC